MSQAMLLPGVCAGERPVGMSQPQPGGFHRAYKSDVQEDNERTLEALLRPHKPPTPLEGGLELVSVRRIGRGRGKHGAS